MEKPMLSESMPYNEICHALAMIGEKAAEISAKEEKIYIKKYLIDVAMLMNSMHEGAKNYTLTTSYSEIIQLLSKIGEDTLKYTSSKSIAELAEYVEGYQEFFSDLELTFAFGDIEKKDYLEDYLEDGGKYLAIGEILVSYQSRLEEYKKEYHDIRGELNIPNASEKTITRAKLLRLNIMNSEFYIAGFKGISISKYLDYSINELITLVSHYIVEYSDTDDKKMFNRLDTLLGLLKSTINETNYFDAINKIVLLRENMLQEYPKQTKFHIDYSNIYNQLLRIARQLECEKMYKNNSPKREYSPELQDQVIKPLDIYPYVINELDQMLEITKEERQSRITKPKILEAMGYILEDLEVVKQLTGDIPYYDLKRKMQVRAPFNGPFCLLGVENYEAPIIKGVCRQANNLMTRLSEMEKRFTQEYLATNFGNLSKDEAIKQAYIALKEEIAAKGESNESLLTEYFDSNRLSKKAKKSMSSQIDNSYSELMYLQMIYPSIASSAHSLGVELPSGEVKKFVCPRTDN